MRKNIVSNKIIELNKISKKNNKLEYILRDLSFTVKTGEFVCIIGLSGSGKSTLLKLIANLEQPDSGKIIRPEKISMIFQGGALFPWLSVEDNIAIGLQSQKLSKSEKVKTVNTYMKLVGLEEFRSRFPRELSGGQRQRVGIARALVADPDVLLLDEPFAALDIKTTEELRTDLLKIWQSTKKTMIMVSHSIEEAVLLANRIILIDNHTIKRIFTISIPRPRLDSNQKYITTVHRIKKML